MIPISLTLNRRISPRACIVFTMPILSDDQSLRRDFTGVVDIGITYILLWTWLCFWLERYFSKIHCGSGNTVSTVTCHPKVIHSEMSNCHIPGHSYMSKSSTSSSYATIINLSLFWVSPRPRIHWPRSKLFDIVQERRQVASGRPLSDIEVLFFVVKTFERGLRLLNPIIELPLITAVINFRQI